MGVVGALQSDWSDDRVEMLRKLWRDGLSASQIAGELGGVTRNGVIGKVHRLGLSGRIARQQPRIQIGGGVRRVRQTPFRHDASAADEKRARRQEASGLATKLRAARDRRADLVEAVAEDQAKDLPADQSPFAVTFAELGEKHCRHPLGDPTDRDNFRFCGADRHDKPPYCARHCMLNYTPAAQRLSISDPSMIAPGRKPQARGGVMNGAWS